MARQAVVLALSALVATGARGQEAPPGDRIGARIRGLIAELADDDVRWNATRAMSALEKYAEAAIPELEQSLDSPDWQQRQLCAALLRRLDLYEPNRSMLQVTIEGLRHDDLPREQRDGRVVRRTYVNNAEHGTRYLLEHATAAEDLLVAGLASDDAQQRFLCAYILGATGHDAAVERIAEVLIPHLRDNDIRGDAVPAVCALYRAGRRVIPYLLDAAADADVQQRRLIELIVLDLMSPPRTRAELESRKSMHDITDRYHDPAVELDPSDIDLIGWDDGLPPGSAGAEADGADAESSP